MYVRRILRDAASRLLRMRGGLIPHLPATAHAVFERGQLLDADRPARMHTPGGDADLGTEAEFAAIGKLRRSIVQDDCGIDLA
jgi:hypothetical protein